jgi:hypothetical protein
MALGFCVMIIVSSVEGTLPDPGCCPDQNLEAGHTRAETQANAYARK